MTRQAQVGAFAILALLLLFGVFYVISGFWDAAYRLSRRSALPIGGGRHARRAGVLQRRGRGSVDSIKLLDDNTVDVILAVNHEIDIPSASKFLIQAPLTGSPVVVIIPPRQKPPVPLLPREVLPISEQPHGINGSSVADLLEQGQGELRRFDTVMALVEARTPKLLDTLQTTLNNANDLTLSTKSSLARLSDELLALGNNLQGSLTNASANIVELSATLNSSATVDSKKVGALLDQFQSTAVSLNRSMTALQDLATDPRLKANILATTESIAETTQTLAALTKDLRTVTGDPQTQAQMRNTIANLDAVMQKANSLLGELGGKSSVYGVDAGASPAPLTVPSTSPYPGGAPVPSGTATPGGVSPELRSKLQSKLASLARNLIAVQVRLSGLSPAHNLGLNPVLTESQGPLGDINMVLLPHGGTSLMVGANAIGTNTTWNALLEKNANDFHLGGGRSLLADRRLGAVRTGTRPRLRDAHLRSHLSDDRPVRQPASRARCGALLRAARRHARVAPQHVRSPVSVLVGSESGRPRVGIIGAGAMGTLFGFHLAANCDVTILDDNAEVAAAVARDGLRVNDEPARKVAVAARARDLYGSQDALSLRQGRRHAGSAAGLRRRARSGRARDLAAKRRRQRRRDQDGARRNRPRDSRHHDGIVADDRGGTRAKLAARQHHHRLDDRVPDDRAHGDGTSHAQRPAGGRRS